MPHLNIRGVSIFAPGRGGLNHSQICSNNEIRSLSVWTHGVLKSKMARIKISSLIGFEIHLDAGSVDPDSKFSPNMPSNVEFEKLVLEFFKRALDLISFSKMAKWLFLPIPPPQNMVSNTQECCYLQSGQVKSVDASSIKFAASGQDPLFTHLSRLLVLLRRPFAGMRSHPRLGIRTTMHPKCHHRRG
ncbi:hypothetical protein BJX68DRAFT_151837 [Aspergillus pseudodeflectus]|uniref:Uncharacterized protein n=1 Tax=Aspergillus pseudodeflectus TaxID=176178 RepID=A0ABR4JVE4_9EURO